MPGATFVFGFTRRHNPFSEPTPLDQYLPIGLVVALLAAILFDVLWLDLWKLVLSVWHLPAPDAKVAIALLAGSLSGKEASETYEVLAAYPVRIGSYFCCLPVATWFAGSGLHWAVQKFRPADPTASWHSLLKPDGPDFVWLTADVHLDSRCYLFAGAVREFSVDKNGHLERVVLGAAVRKILDEEAQEDLSPDESPTSTEPKTDPSASSDQPLTLTKGWVEIPGEFVVLLMNKVRTVNIDYFYVEPPAGGNNLAAMAE